MKRFFWIALLMMGCQARMAHKVAEGAENLSLIGGAGVGVEDPVTASIPLLALVNAEGKIIQQCTAALVAPEVALTAAHCFYHHEGDQYNLLNSAKIILVFSRMPIQYLKQTQQLPDSGRDQVILGHRFRIHPSYRASDQDPDMTASDLALVKLSRPAPSGTLIFPLAPSRMPQPQELVIYGFGEETTHPRTAAEDLGTRLKKTFFRFVTDATKELSQFTDFDEAREKNLKILKKSVGLGQAYFAVRQSEVNALGHGDSGGPALGLDTDGQMKILGVTSHGLLDNGRIRVALYPNISFPATHDWLEEEIEFLSGRR